MVDTLLSAKRASGMLLMESWLFCSLNTCKARWASTYRLSAWPWHSPSASGTFTGQHPGTEDDSHSGSDQPHSAQTSHARADLLSGEEMLSFDLFWGNFPGSEKDPAVEGLEEMSPPEETVSVCFQIFSAPWIGWLKGFTPIDLSCLRNERFGSVGGREERKL